MGRDIFIFAAGAILTVLTVRLSPESPFWDWLILAGVTAMILSLGHGCFRRLREHQHLDPLLAATMVGLVLAFVSLGLFLFKGPPPTKATTVTTRQPDFVLSAPSERYDFTWEPSHDMRLAIRKNGETNTDFTQNPAFILKKLNSVIAYDVTVTWKSEISGVANLVKASPRLAKQKFDLTDEKLVLYAASGVPVANFIYYLAPTPTQNIAIVAKDAEAYLPIQIWPLAALYLIDKMPDKVAETTEPFVFHVTVAWKVPEEGAKLEFRVRMTATNTKPSGVTSPEVAAVLNFSVEKLN